MADTQQNKRQRDGADDGKDGQEKRIRCEYDYDNLITVLVGKRERRFSVHKDNICAKSRFFAAACSPDRWREGKEKLVRLPEAGPRAFQAYVHWVYTGELVAEVHWGKASLSEEEMKNALVEGFPMGDILDDAGLRRKAMDLLILSTLDWTVSLSLKTVHRIWRATPKGSPLRKFYVRILINRVYRSSLAKSVAEYPPELTQELVLELMQRTKIITHREDLIKDLQDAVHPDKCTL